MLSQIVLASNNAGKLREFAALFAAHRIQILPQSAFNTPECAEPYGTFVENALAKARHASQHSGLPALADDSGICINALGGAPGVHSARYAGCNPKSDAANNAKASAELAPHADKSCYYPTIRNPSSPRAFGAGNGSLKAQANTALATTRIFICPNTAAPPRSLRPQSKTKSATAPKR